MASLTRPAVVMDVGSGYTKLGFGGNMEPSFVEPTVVALNSTALDESLPGAGVVADMDFRIGTDAVARHRSGSYTTTRPVRLGQVVDWEAVVRLWQGGLFGMLRVDPEEHTLLLTESAVALPEHRETTAEIMFETFNVAGLYIAPQPVLALTAANAAAQAPLTGMVVDVGECSTTVAPVVEGCILPGSVRSSPLGGAQLTAFMLQMLRDKGAELPKDQEAAFEVARRVKETCGYICSDTSKEFAKHDKEPAKYTRVWRGAARSGGTLYSCQVGLERFLIPEALFCPDVLRSHVNPASLGSILAADVCGTEPGALGSQAVSLDAVVPLPQLLHSSILSAPIDTRRALYKNVVLSGGSSLFRDFGRRLQRDVRKLVDARQQQQQQSPPPGAPDMHGSAFPAEASSSGAGSVEVSVVSYQLQDHAVWFGGSIVASTPGFASVCHTREQYGECGPRICRTRQSALGL